MYADITELTWGMPVVAYLFLAGVGAGALTVSASVLLRGGGGGFGGAHFSVARYGALIAPVPVMIGCGLLVLELGSFQTGHWLRWLNLYKVINLSPMSVGTWLLTVFILISLPYAWTFVRRGAGPHDALRRLRRGLAWVIVPIGIGVGIYTGVLLGAMPARPFWNSPVLAMLFMLSSLSTGVAIIMLARAIFQRLDGTRDAVNGAAAHRRSEDLDAAGRYHQSGYLLTATDTILIGFELLAVFLFLMFAHLTVGDVAYAVRVIQPGGPLAAEFWIWVVLLGLVLPALIEIYYVIPKLLGHRAYHVPYAVELAVPVLVLAGGFMLRYVALVAGQITGPIGI